MRRIKKKRKLPVLKCYVTPFGTQLKAWCPFCEKWHFHGVGSGLRPREKAHVVAHCISPDSPFKDGGYYLRLMNATEVKEITNYGKNPGRIRHAKICGYTKN